MHDMMSGPYGRQRCLECQLINRRKKYGWMYGFSQFGVGLLVMAGIVLVGYMAFFLEPR